MGGSIVVTSELGRGSTFEVYLPRSQTAAAAAAPVDDGRADRGTETVLVVEDESAVRRGVARTLRDRGYGVLVAGNRDEALAIVRGHGSPIDLIVCDVVLPGASGPRIVADVRALVPGLPAIMMSGYSDHEVVNGVRASGDAFLQKPFSPPALARKVRTVLDNLRAFPIVDGDPHKSSTMLGNP